MKLNCSILGIVAVISITVPVFRLFRVITLHVNALSALPRYHNYWNHGFRFRWDVTRPVLDDR